MPEVIPQQGLADTPQRLLDRGDLSKNIGTVAILFDHLLKTANLTFDSAEPLQVGRLDAGVDRYRLSPAVHLASACRITGRFRLFLLHDFTLDTPSPYVKISPTSDKTVQFSWLHCANCGSSMLSRWCRSLALLIAAALLLNSQCYAVCALCACAPTDCTSHCRHHKSHSPKNDFSQICNIQYSVVNPENSSSMCKLTEVHTSVACVSASTAEPQPGYSLADQFWPGRCDLYGHTGISVLAVLSTFRI